MKQIRSKTFNSRVCNTSFSMGITISPEDALRKRRIEVIAKDLNPSLRESVLKILEEWQGTSSKEKLLKLIGEEEGNRILKQMGLE